MPWVVKQAAVGLEPAPGNCQRQPLCPVKVSAVFMHMLHFAFPGAAVPPGQALVSGAYALLAGPEGGIDSAHPDHPARRSLAGGPGQQGLPSLRLSSAPFQLASAAVQAWGREPPLTTRTATFSGTLDYVFLSRGHWVVGEALALPYRFDPAPAGQHAAVNHPADVPLAQLSAIPNHLFPSDHLPLAFRLHLLPAGGG